MNTYECVVSIIRSKIKWDDLSIEEKQQIATAIESWYNWHMAPLVTFISSDNKKKFQIKGVCNDKDVFDDTFLFVNQHNVTLDYTKILLNKSIYDITENITWIVPFNGAKVQLIAYE